MDISSVIGTLPLAPGITTDTHRQDNAAPGQAFEAMFLRLMLESSGMFDEQGQGGLAGMGVWKDVVLDGLSAELAKNQGLGFGALLIRNHLDETGEEHA